MNRQQLARYLQNRERSRKSEGFSAEALCFGPQLAFVRDPSRFKVAVCSRRAGKTTGVAVSLLEDALREPFTNQFYVTKTLKNARKIIWPELKRINREYNLGGTANETEAFMRFPALPSEPCIYLAGAKDESESDNIRGLKGKKAVVDEPQSMRTSVLEKLMKDAVRPALWDYAGSLWVTGTPGPVRAGYFYDIDQGEQAERWSHHHWTILDNPWIQKLSGRLPEELLQEEREQRGVGESDPTYQREAMGRWVHDESALVFKYEDARNGFAKLPEGRMSYVMGVDLGFEDADAIAVLGWSPNSQTVYLVEEVVERKQSVSELADKVKALYQRYRPLRLVADFGGLGKKIAEEIRRRHALPMEAADKARKFEHIALLNDALTAGRLLARPAGHFAEDAALVQWDVDARAKGVLKIAEDYHSDITDAVLYAFRACYAYLEQPAPPPPENPQAAWLAKLAAEERSRTRLDPIAAFLGYSDSDD